MSQKRRARVKSTNATPTRAQAVAEFGRKKARIRRQQFKRRALLVSGGLVASYLAVGSFIMYHNGALAKRVEATNAHWWQFTADAGFKVSQVYLSGRNHAEAADVKAALQIAPGQPILAVSLAEMQARLKQIPEVKSASISRVLPDKIAIQLTERVPAALWQHEGQTALVDAEGVVLAASKYHGVTNLPVVVGEDAPKHIEEFVALMKATPELKNEVVAAIRVGSRRWNVQLKRDIIVMLPEDAPTDAWKRFASLVNEKALLTKAVRSIDMRMEDRVFIMPVETNKPPVTLTSARST